MATAVSLAHGWGALDRDVELAILLWKSNQHLQGTSDSQWICLTEIEQVESLGKSLLITQVFIGFPLLYAQWLTRIASDSIVSWPRHWVL